MLVVGWGGKACFADESIGGLNVCGVCPMLVVGVECSVCLNGLVM
jgi:hypothetical protein